MIECVKVRAGEPANILAAPAPYFFFKRLRLRLLVFFLEWLRLQGAKKTAPAPVY